MPKKHPINTPNLELNVMKKIKSGSIVMKPRWYFVVGAILSTVGLASLAVLATFLTNLTIFLLKKHGPFGQWRLQQIIESFPVWIPILAITGTVLGIWMLKKYDFSYKKNFWMIVILLVISIILTAFLLDLTGLDNLWMKRGPMQRFYRNLGAQSNPGGMYPGRGRMMMQ